MSIWTKAVIVLGMVWLFCMPTQGTRMKIDDDQAALPPNNFFSLRSISKLGCQPDERGNCIESLARVNIQQGDMP